MKTTLLFTAILISLNATVIYCQDESNEISTFGVGIHMEQFKTNDLTDPYYVPITKFVLNININNSFRLEPEIGFNIWN